MSDIPPKQPVSGTASARVDSAYGFPPLSQAEPSPDLDATGALVSLHHAASQAGTDSFPVLKAFQEYLESERRRARRRVALVSALFAGILVFVIAVFLVAGLLMFRYMKENQDNLWRKLDAQAAPPPAVTAPVPAVAAAAPETAALSAEFKRLGAALADLKRDNEQLRAALKPHPSPDKTPVSPPSPVMPTANRQLPTVPPPSPVLPTANRQLPTVPPPPPAPRPPAAVAAAAPRSPALEVPAGVKPPQPPAGFTDGGIYLQPGGKGVPIPWRVYLPAGG